MARLLRQLLLCAALVSVALAQEPKVVRVGVPPMQNTSRRSVNTRLQRDRLVRDFQQSQKKKKKNDTVTVVAVPLDATTVTEIGREAKEKNCDYILETELVSLRTAGDPQERNRPGSVSLGSDPLGANPGPPYMNEPVHHAVVDYRLFRVSDTQPLLDLSVSGTENTDENETVSRLLGQIVSRVASEIRGNQR